MNKYVKPLRLAVLASLAISSSVFGENLVIGQENDGFVVDGKPVTHVTINKGDEIAFVNNDPYFHNILSMSSARFFDLGSFPKGESRTVKFKKKGTVEVLCSIHPKMKMTIEVQGPDEN